MSITDAIHVYLKRKVGCYFWAAEFDHAKVIGYLNAQGWTGTAISTSPSLPAHRIVMARAGKDNGFFNPQPNVFVPQINIRTVVAQVGGGGDLICVGDVDMIDSIPFGAWDPWVIVVEHHGRWEEANNLLFSKLYRTLDLGPRYLVMGKREDV